MNYRHSYHAGNSCDVVKHVTLIALLTHLMRKETPLCYIDTHAGTGFYDLFSTHAQKNKEYLEGVEKIIHHPSPPPLIQSYLNDLRRTNDRLSGSEGASLRYYPGSPLIARALMRPKDRMIVSELHPEEYRALKYTFANDEQVAVHHADGFLGLKAFLPPEERRGLVLIDPPYERPDEFKRIVQALTIALERFPTGVYATWFPIKDPIHCDAFFRGLRQMTKNDIFIINLTIYPDLPSHLNGSGLAIINPPWQFDLTMNALLPWMWKALTIKQQGAYSGYFLK